jgi:hypothetical protein
LQIECAKNVENISENIEFIAGIYDFQKKVIAKFFVTRYRWFVPNRRA